MRVLIINGPNLSRLDIRDSAIYGDMTYAQLSSHIESAAKTHGFNADIRQSDDEATIIGWLHEACLLYTSPSPRDGLLSRMPSSA